MPRGSKTRKSGRSEIGTLKLMNALLIIIIAGLVLYIIWPSIKLATAAQPLGNTLAGINSRLTPSQLSTINNASDSDFEKAGEMMLNLSLPNEGVSNDIYYADNFQIVLNPNAQIPEFDYNGKPSVIYIGAISCMWCGENRWAMALALSKFGSFNSLYIGYSSIHDEDFPTLYWTPEDIYSNGSASFGNSYSSPYVNFFTAEYDSNITAGFEFPTTSDPLSLFVNSAPNSSYQTAMGYMDSANEFSGTPYTLWGTVVNKGADAVVFGLPQNATIANSQALPLTYMTHQQVFNQLHDFNTTFAYEEYAAADVYIAQLCPSINNSAPICSEPAIRAFEQKMGLS